MRLEPSQYNGSYEYPKHVFWLRNKFFSVKHSAVKILVAGRYYREICDFCTIIKKCTVKDQK